MLAHVFYNWVIVTCPSLVYKYKPKARAKDRNNAPQKP